MSHYVLLGEGSFSYSACLVLYLRDGRVLGASETTATTATSATTATPATTATTAAANTVVATGWDSRENMLTKYPEGRANLRLLESVGKNRKEKQTRKRKRSGADNDDYDKDTGDEDNNGENDDNGENTDDPVDVEIAFNVNAVDPSTFPFFPPSSLGSRVDVMFHHPHLGREGVNELSGGLVMHFLDSFREALKNNTSGRR